MVQQSFSQVMVTGRFVASKDLFRWSVVSDLKSDIVNARVEITEHELSARSEDHKWREEVHLDKIEAGASTEEHEYKKSWYCDSVFNCMLRITVRDADGVVIAQNHVWPMGLAAMKVENQPLLTFTVSPGKPATILGRKYAVAKVWVENTKNGKSVASIHTTLTLEAAVVKGHKVQQLHGFFSENVFVLLPGESKQVMFAAKQEAGQEVMTDDELVRRLTEQIKLRSYNDMLKYV